jgi:hypothetical protein
MALAGAIHANQFVRHFAFVRDRGIDALRLPAKIRVDSAKNHAGVV